LAENIDFISSTEYEFYKMIKNLNVSSSKDRIKENKESLSNSIWSQMYISFNIHFKHEY